MRPEDYAAIRALPLFADARDNSFSSLIVAGYLQRFPPNVTLIREGTPADFLYVVMDGLVEMFSASERHETTIALLRPVSTFILAAVLSDQMHLQSARTLKPSTILMMPARKVREAMEDDPVFMRAIVAELARGYRTMLRDLKNQKLRTGPERLAAWLLCVHAFNGAGDEIVLDIEKRTLAARLGMTPETLSRALAALRPHGVSSHGARIALQPDVLSRFMKLDPLIDAREGNVW